MVTNGWPIQENAVFADWMAGVNRGRQVGEAQMEIQKKNASDLARKKRR